MATLPESNPEPDPEEIDTVLNCGICGRAKVEWHGLLLCVRDDMLNRKDRMDEPTQLTEDEG